MENVDIARALLDVADLLEIAGDANPFRVRAYRNAARTVEAHTVPLRRMVEEGADLSELPAIGAEMAGHIAELVKTGNLTVMRQVAKKVPRTLIDLVRLPGVGPKRAKRLWLDLDVKTVDQLERAARAGKVAGLEGFGEKTQQKILEGIGRRREQPIGRVKLSDADQYVEPLLQHLRAVRGLSHLDVAGSFRRRRETVGDIDLLAVASEPGPVMERFTAYGDVAEVLASGETKGSVRLRSGLQVDLRIVAPESYGAALVYFTGSKPHNVKLRTRALERGLSISEYGVFELAGGKRPKGDDGEAGKFLVGATEVEVYRAVDLAWIPPELREDQGEIEAAAKGALPELVTLSDIRGDLQMHSTWSDGIDSAEVMLEACEAKGYEYFALTDHSKALAMTRGLDLKRLKEQWSELDEVTARHPKIRLLRGMEVDILADGTLDLEDEGLAMLDVVVISVHSRFDLPKAKQTKRLLKALEHPQANILGHPTGRMINEREGMQFDVSEVFACAKQHGVIVEVNAQPHRLDLKDIHVLEAKRQGLRVVISTDAHRTRELDFMHYGVEQARRGWLTSADVVNSLPLSKLQRLLDKR